jgi:hypothetical protein
MSSERPRLTEQDVQIIFGDEVIMDAQSIQASSLEEALDAALEEAGIPVAHAAAEQAVEAAPPAPAAIEEEPVQLTDMEKLLASFAGVEEKNLYSDSINRAIEIISGAETMQQALQSVQENEMDYRHLLFRQIEHESQHLDRFMYELQRIPSLPSLEVDFI